MKTKDNSNAKNAIRFEVEFDTNNENNISNAIGILNAIAIFTLFMLSLLNL